MRRSCLEGPQSASGSQLVTPVPFCPALLSRTAFAPAPPVLSLIVDTHSYGPTVGLTRLQRWHRAKALGEEPPEEVRAILETKQGALEHADNLFVGTGI